MPDFKIDQPKAGCACSGSNSPATNAARCGASPSGQIRQERLSDEQILRDSLSKKLQLIQAESPQGSLHAKRLLNEGSQHYQPYSIPVSRMPSLSDDVGTAHVSPAISRSNSGDVWHPVEHGRQKVTFHLDTGEHSSPEGSYPPTPELPPEINTSDLLGDPNNPYRRAFRIPQSKSLADIPAQFRFEKPSRHGHSHHSKSLLRKDAPGLLSSLNSVNHYKAEHPHSKGKDSFSPVSSYVELKRFFKHHTKHEKHKSKKSAEDSAGEDHRFSKDAGYASNDEKPSAEVAKARKLKDKKAPTTPLLDDRTGLFKKYGKLGKVLGAGAGGSVRLMKRANDGVVFAVKEFRVRSCHETEREYSKKVTAEFCVGSTLHHQNIIEALDIIKEHGKWYEVMEYAPYDLFATVMSGNMTKPEIWCCFKQIMNGVKYLHGLGLAHRDLKLDNCVMNEDGIVKIIDFGCATVFKYPFENDIVLATGIVGSDPYLAPEVCSEIRYDPQPADIWSVGIIFCCMSLRRFPWKSPRLTDPSYKQFAQIEHISSLSSAKNEPVPNISAGADHNQPQPVIKGPWRLLRVLPRETRRVIYGMLTINPKLRVTISEIYKDPWFQSIEYCAYQTTNLNGISGMQGSDKNTLLRASNHTHNLVSSQHSATA